MIVRPSEEIFVIVCACTLPCPLASFTSSHSIMLLFSVEAMVRGYHAYKDCCCWRRISMQVWRWHQGRFFHCGCNERRCCHRPHSKEDLVYMFSLLLPRWLNHLPCDRFACSKFDVSKFCTLYFQFSQFLFLYLQVLCKISENLHHS